MKQNIIARFTVKPEKISDFIKSSHILVDNSRKEKGCLTYNMYQESFDKKNKFIVYEIYKDEESLSVHNKSKHLSDFIDKIKNLLDEEPTVEKHDLN